MAKPLFFSDLSAAWDERHACREEMERLISFSAHFRLRPGERVLDAGCGSGRLIPVVRDKIGRDGSLVELDFAPGMLARGRKKSGTGNVSFVLGDAHSLPFPDRDFDRVIALAVLPHLDDKEAALREFFRVLKPGGMLVIAHQMGREALNRLHGQSGKAVCRDLLPPNHVLTALLTAVGFSAIEILDTPDQYVAWGQA